MCMPNRRFKFVLHRSREIEEAPWLEKKKSEQVAFLTSSTQQWGRKLQKGFQGREA